MKISALRNFVFTAIGIKMKSIGDDELINVINKSNKSLIRWGDGETIIANGGSIYFQRFEEGLQKDLLQIVDEYDKGSKYILAVPTPFITKCLFSLNKKEIKIWHQTRYFFKKHVRRSMKYGNSLLFRKLLIEDKIDNLDIIRMLVHGKSNLIFVTGNDLSPRVINTLAKDYKISTILVESKNAYTTIEDIVKRIENAISKFNDNIQETCVILSCGPTAKSIILRMNIKSGCQFLDAGAILNEEQLKEKYNGRKERIII